ncbi:MAG: DoxX family protein [Candidatus Pacebacteria bacterium]|nr:DoxX family protein [Candidatus Paceibacterota bacterium]
MDNATYYETMSKFVQALKAYAPSVLRYGMVAVILWFSLQQFLHNSLYTAYVPDSIVALTHLGAGTLVFFNAAFELVFGVALAFGWQTRIVSLLLALHLFDIMYTVGYGEIGTRDFGLAIATFVVFMNGPDMLCIQRPKKSAQISMQPAQQVQPTQYITGIRPPRYTDGIQPIQSSQPPEQPFRQPRKFV